MMDGSGFLKCCSAIVTVLILIKVICPVSIFVEYNPHCINVAFEQKLSILWLVHTRTDPNIEFVRVRLVSKEGYFAIPKSGDLGISVRCCARF